MDSFLSMLTEFRIAWIAGRWGAGKTSLAVHLAIQAVLTGRTQTIVTNLKLKDTGVTPVLIGADDVAHIEDAWIIMDEAWQYLGSGMWKNTKAWTAYVRKRKQVLLLPSVSNLTGQVRTVKVQRQINFCSLGVPLWMYQYAIQENKDKKPYMSRLFWWKPTEVFSYYDSGQEPDEGVFYVYDFRKVESLES